MAQPRRTPSPREQQAAEFHATSRIEEVPLAKLHVDASYQREPSQIRVDEIAAEWDVIASELILVSDRGPRSTDSGVEGGMFVINGQHRTLGAKKIGLEKIWARVVDLRKEADPAKIEADFRIKTNVRLGDRPLERFKAQVRAGYEDSLAIVKLLDKFDTEINLVPDTHSGLNSVSTVEGLYAVDQGPLLSDTLSVIADAFKVVGGKHTSAGMLKGIAWFIDRHGADVDRDRLVDRISMLGVAALDRRARTIQSTMGGTYWLNMYRTMVDAYNEKLADRNKLEWKTRGNATFAPTARRKADRQHDVPWASSTGTRM